LLALIDAVEQAGVEAADVAPTYWQHVHNCFLCGEHPRSYGRDQHHGWLLWRGILVPSRADCGYLPRGVPLLKRVAAVAGQTVCERDSEVSIDGGAVADALPVDGRGHKITPWSGCGKLSNGEIFMLIPCVPTVA
jgi:hypothetical protein